MTHTEQIKVVAEYMGWHEVPSAPNSFTDYVSTFHKTNSQFRYDKSLDSLSPVYKKVMGELKQIATLATSLKMAQIRHSFTSANPKEIFEHLCDAIKFLTENKEK